MSTAVEVLPATLVNSDVPFQTDRAIVNATDISALHSYAEKVKDITKDVQNLEDPHNLGVFSLTTELPKETGGSLYEYSAGPLNFKIQVDRSNHILLQTFFSPPLFAPILVGTFDGTLDQNISVILGPANILDGTVKIVKGAADKHILQYNVTLKIVNVHYQGDITLGF